MKKLQNLVGVKTLSKKEQQAVKGGKMHSVPCKGTYEACQELNGG